MCSANTGGKEEWRNATVRTGKPGREEGVNAASAGTAGRSQLSSKEESYCFLPSKPEQASVLSPPYPTQASVSMAPRGWPGS